MMAAAVKSRLDKEPSEISQLQTRIGVVSDKHEPSAVTEPRTPLNSASSKKKQVLIFIGSMVIEAHSDLLLVKIIL